MSRTLLAGFVFAQLGVAAFAADKLRAGDEVRLLPSSVVLTGPTSRQRVLVEEFIDGQAAGPASGNVAWTVSVPGIVKVVDGELVPFGNGHATVTVKSGTRTAQLDVKVIGFDRPEEWSFRNHVLAIFAKAGCNGGACHGALAGKGGFRLSLRGYDPATDHQTIVTQARGRRIELADPGRSLILAKPTGALPSQRRFTV